MDEREGLPDAATSEPDGAVIVGWRGDWQQHRVLVGSRVKALLQSEREESHGIDLFLGAFGLGH